MGTTDEQNQGFSTGSVNLFKQVLMGLSEAELEAEFANCKEAYAQASVHFRTVASKEAHERKFGELNNAQWAFWTAYDNFHAALAECERRAKEDALRAETEPTLTPEQMQEAITLQRIDSLAAWIEQAGELTDMGRTLMSMALHLASVLPTEGAYNPQSWGYAYEQGQAQNAEEALVKARKKALHATQYIEMAIRAVDALRNHIISGNDDATTRRDNVPF